MRAVRWNEGQTLMAVRPGKTVKPRSLWLAGTGLWQALPGKTLIIFGMTVDAGTDYKPGTD